MVRNIEPRNAEVCNVCDIRISAGSFRHHLASDKHKEKFEDDKILYNQIDELIGQMAVEKNESLKTQKIVKFEPN